MTKRKAKVDQVGALVDHCGRLKADVSDATSLYDEKRDELETAMRKLRLTEVEGELFRATCVKTPRRTLDTERVLRELCKHLTQRQVDRLYVSTTTWTVSVKARKHGGKKRS